MIATWGACKGCGEQFYGFGYAGEPCSAACAEKLEQEPVDSERP